MRRLPVYFVIDVSESMVGEPIQLVESGLMSLVQELRRDPFALESVYISIIAFAGKARKVSPLIDLMSFYLPKLPVGGGTSLGKALEFVMDDMDKEVTKSSPTTKGDWKPIVFLITDGVPTDDAKKAIERWQKQYSRKTFMVAVSIGKYADVQLLGQLTNEVFALKDTEAESYKKFFRWVTMSIKSSSASITSGDLENINLAKTDDTAMAKIDITKSANALPVIDDNFAILAARCQSTRKPYLIKFRKSMRPANLPGLDFKTRVYQLEGSYPVESSYFEMTEGTAASGLKISTSDLVGAPRCPHCANLFGFATCVCGGIMCSQGEGLNECPWCGTEATFGFGTNDFDVSRTRG